MKAHQFTVAFVKAVNITELVKVLKQHYGDSVEVGQGLLHNGVHQDWIVVHNERPNRVD